MPSTGGRTEDEAHNFDRIVNSWHLIPEGTKFSQGQRRGGEPVLRQSRSRKVEKEPGKDPDRRAKRREEEEDNH
jgi:hypothetical protein